MNNTNRSFLIIGGSGFIGSRLIRRLLGAWHSIINLDKVISETRSIKTIVADIALPINDLLVSDVSVIIHLAAVHRDDVRPLSLYDTVNVGGAKNVCEFARARSINKIIFTSSVAVYGFAQPGTSELGMISPFNDYGRTKWEAEEIFKSWHAEDPHNRTLVIIRPTVVFGERNRGNVFNLLRAIAHRKFIMVGSGMNRKSMAYVENVAAFLEFSLKFAPGIHLYNYADKPDFTTSALFAHVNELFGRSTDVKFRLPLSLGLLIGECFDLIGKICGVKFSISAIRVKKFCANSVYNTAVESTGFIPPVPLKEAIEKTVRFEFMEDNNAEQVL